MLKEWTKRTRRGVEAILVLNMQRYLAPDGVKWKFDVKVNPSDPC